MRRIVRFFTKDREERRLDAELRFHLDQQVGANVAAGMDPQEARRRAHLDFGGLELIKEECRDARGMHLLDTLCQDVRFGARVLRRSPGFTATAMLTIALGIGANTAVFSLLYGLAFRSLPVPHPEQLVRFGAHTGDDPSVGLSLPMFEDIARTQTVFAGVFAWSGDGVFNVEIDRTPSRADVWAVAGNFQSELGAAPEIGRLIELNDVDLHAPATSQVAVLSYNFWKRRYGGSADVVGKTLKIEGSPFTIIGVTRKDFGGFSAEASPEITVPLTSEPLLVSGAVGHADVQKTLQRPTALWLEAAGRLRPSTSLQAARAQLESLWPAVRERVISANQSTAERNRLLGLRLKVESGARGASFLRNRFTQPLYLLLAIAGLLLLVACVNLASLTLARTASRGHEISVRVALGASRMRLVRQMLTESIMLSVGGLLGGLALAYWGSRALSNLIIREIYIVPAEVNVTPDLRILSFAAAAAVLTGIFFGLAPAWRSTREDPRAALQDSSRVLGVGTGRLGKGLIVTQIALSLISLAGAGLFTRTLQELRAVDPGFRTRGLLDVRLSAKPGGYSNLDFVSYYHQLIERVSTLPGVASAAIVHMQPGSVNSWTEEARLKDATVPGRGVDFDMVMPGAFRTMGIGVLRGRDFTWRDDEYAPRVAIVSRSFADRFIADKDAIGQSIEITSRPQWQSIQIVGIAADASLYDLHKHAPPTVYLPPMQYGADWSGWGEILVQTELPANAVTDSVRQVVESFGHDSVFRVEAISAGLDRSLLRERVTAMLSAFFGGLALLLAAVGLYGLMAYSVHRRAREIGIRLALGAPRNRVRWLILREALQLAGVGVVIGLPCALGGARLVASMLYGVSTHDAATMSAVSGVLVAVCAVAGWIPAHRATHVDPMVALRYE